MGCKIHCKYCAQNKLVKRYMQNSSSQITELNFETFKKCLDKIPQTVRIDFSGMAEPWHNKECTEMLLYAAKKNHEIAVYTTLSGMTREDFNRIKHIHFAKFEIHLSDAAGNCKIEITQDYLDLLNTIVKVSPSHIRDAIHFTCNGPLHPKLAEIVTLTPDNTYNEVDNRAGNLEHPELEHRFRKDSLQCKSAERFLNHNVLLPDGTVLLCSMDYNMDHILGNLIDDAYEDLFTSKEALKILKAFDDDTIPLLCRKCYNAGICSRAKKPWKYFGSIKGFLGINKFFR